MEIVTRDGFCQIFILNSQCVFHKLYESCYSVISGRRSHHGLRPHRSSVVAFLCLQTEWEGDMTKLIVMLVVMAQTLQMKCMYLM